MSYASGFDNDLFISYAHIDNQALDESEEGWVSRFHRALEVRLRQVLGAEAKVWRDAKLQGNDIFGDTLIDQFPGVALLVSVLSPRYVQSEWCRRELDTFLETKAKTGGLRFGDRAAVFKVVKTPVPLDQQPELLQAMLGYEFYEVDAASSRPREFRQETGPNKDLRYWDKLEALVYDIADLLKRIRQLGGATGGDGGAAPARDAVYLAPTTTDLGAEHDAIQGELRQRGYPVLPTRPLPQSGPAIEEAVRADLERAVLSIHLIGGFYGVVPEASEVSVVELQNSIAAERSATAGLPRLIWMPPGLEPGEERQRHFVEQLQTDHELQRGADVLATDLGELKAAIRHVLEGGGRVPEHRGPGSGEPPEVYVIYSEEDADPGAQLEDYLFDAGCEVLSPLLDGDPEEIAADHRDSLQRCDAAIVLCAEASDRWLRTQLRQLEDAAAARPRPMGAQAVYLAAPETREKTRLRTRKALVIKQLDAFSPQAAAPFVEAVLAARGDAP